MLILDVGNSRIKWGWWQRREFLRLGSAATAADLPGPNDLGLPSNVTAPRVCAVSVSAEDTQRRLADAVRGKWGVTVEFLSGSGTYRGVRCAYGDPTRLGVDRWAAIIGGYARYGLPLAVVDCGTALTVDYVDGQGRHRGGVIAPGLTTMRRSLHGGTARLPQVEGPAAGLLADNTADAIRNGTFEMLAGGIERIVRAAAAAEPEGREPVYVITGGDAAALLPRLAVTFVHDPQLVLHGAALMAEAA